VTQNTGVKTVTISTRNLKFLALPIPKTHQADQNLLSGHVTPTTPIRGSLSFEG